MPYISPEIVRAVKKIDLFTYLKTYEPDELKHVAGNIGEIGLAKLCQV